MQTEPTDRPTVAAAFEAMLAFLDARRDPELLALRDLIRDAATAHAEPHDPRAFERDRGAVVKPGVYQVTCSLFKEHAYEQTVSEGGIQERVCGVCSAPASFAVPSAAERRAAGETGHGMVRFPPWNSADTDGIPEHLLGAVLREAEEARQAAATKGCATERMSLRHLSLLKQAAQRGNRAERASEAETLALIAEVEEARGLFVFTAPNSKPFVPSPVEPAFDRLARAIDAMGPSPDDIGAWSELTAAWAAFTGARA